MIKVEPIYLFLARRRILRRVLLPLFAVLPTVAGLVGCGEQATQEADHYNDLAYYYHYRSLDSTTVYARRALQVARGDDGVIGESLNNLAFVAIMRMDFPRAKQLCDSVNAITDDQIELLVSDILQMRICQRESRNKDFYDSYQQAGQRLRRIDETSLELTPRQQRRMVYARSEYRIVASAYFYYVGLDRQSAQAISGMGEEDLASDTAQLINYWYCYGAGGLLTKGSKEEIYQQEFDCLMRAYRLAMESRSTFWIANTLQALSEHLLQRPDGPRLMADNPRDIRLINTDAMPDSLLAGNLAERSLQLFRQFGDIYQKAGSLRTLANCYWQIDDYHSALICLEKALEEDTVINRAPDLVASIREQLCIVYSAVDDKQASDYNRNLYLDLQDQTRQDRYYEARADQLDRTSHTLNLMLAAVGFMILLMAGLLGLFAYLRSRGGGEGTIAPLQASLKRWKERDEEHQRTLDDQYEEVAEQLAVSRLHVEANKQRHLEQRAKVSLVNSVLPLIDRMLMEIRRLVEDHEPATLRAERMAYLAELLQQINSSNAMLTEWIQLRQGKLSVRVESFPLQPLFDLVAKGQPEFRMKAMRLSVDPTDAWVKADRVLTLFMVNTLMDNARKYTDEGGTVRVSAQEASDYVEVSVEDTGCGMSEDQVAHLFEYKPISDEQVSAQAVASARRSHGFGLMNCQGIINHYRKLSQLFAVCTLQAESTPGKGSRLFFRLPKGVVRHLVLLLPVLACCLSASATKLSPSQQALLREASLYADSAYHSNIDGTYRKTIRHADSCCAVLNRFYRTVRPYGYPLLSLSAQGKVEVPEVKWLHEGIPANYDVILSMRNEVAVAALALHEWETYQYNNKAYTQLFKESSADQSLPSYCTMMQRSEANKHVAIALLVLLLLIIGPAYYFMYYRHRISFLLSADLVRRLTETLLSDAPSMEKLKAAEAVAHEPLPAALQTLVEEIRTTLKTSAEVEFVAKERIRLLEEQLGRSELEDERLHLSNSTLDNSLSTLKHETMYYPSRMALLLDEGEERLHDIEELAAYYRDLYQLLCLQAMGQLALVPPTGRAVSLGEILPAATRVGDWPGGSTTQGRNERLVGDAEMLRYLFELLRKENGGGPLEVELARKGDDYLLLRVAFEGLEARGEGSASLFTPSMKNLPYLLCSQIVRDNGELTNRRGCGIVATRQDNKTYLTITLARWKNSKSSS